MICWSCNVENADTANYCAHCGVSLDPSLENLGSQIDERIATALDKKLRDQKLVEYEVTEAVVARLAGWGRGLAILVGAILTGLGYLGISEISGTREFIEAAKEDIVDTKEEINQEKIKIESDAIQIASLLEENKEKAKELEEDIQLLKSKIESTDHLVADSRATEALDSSFLGWDPQEAKFNKPENVAKLRTWMAENGFEGLAIPFFLNGLEFAADREKAARDLTEITRPKKLLTNVPESKLAEVVADFENEGANVKISKQDNGNWTVAADFVPPRTTAFAATAIHDRVKNILAKIAVLADNRALELSENPPVELSGQATFAVTASLPFSLPFSPTNPGDARTLLSRMVALGDRSNEVLDAWEKALEDTE